jgi:hypothetical protein
MDAAIRQANLDGALTPDFVECCVEDEFGVVVKREILPVDGAPVATVKPQTAANTVNKDHLIKHLEKLFVVVASINGRPYYLTGPGVTCWRVDPGCILVFNDHERSCGTLEEFIRTANNQPLEHVGWELPKLDNDEYVVVELKYAGLNVEKVAPAPVRQHDPMFA